MQHVKALGKYLSGFPQWKEGLPAVDTTPAIPEGCGLFPRGVEVLKRQEDVTGGVQLRLRQSFLLRRTALRTETSAGWLLALQNWALENPPRELETVFGTNLQLRLEKGRLIRAEQSGTATYEVAVIIEYTKEKHQYEN
ncbi:MAG: hypothetical protein J6A74_01280 [Oscillospiraceae bacterium]|nr:hypothetical protein [Oscillospiraceae bacterium]